MKKVVFYVSKKVLLGEVACKYCYKTKIEGFESLQSHFKSECNVNFNHLETCDCFFCDKDVELFENDGHNVYLNKYTIETYFAIGPFQFWGIITPHYIWKDKAGIFSYEEKSPQCAA
jgi:hypothetical protein